MDMQSLEGRTMRAWRPRAGDAAMPSVSRTLSLPSGVWLDARRAVWLPVERTLVVSDLHLGYAWEARRRGQLLPLGDPESCGRRILALAAEYRPEHLVVLGDVIHGPAGREPLEEAFAGWLPELAARCRVTLVLGNHDTHLPAFLEKRSWPVELCLSVTVGRWTLCHGHQPVEPKGDWWMLGHEHPCLEVDDGVASRVRVPCFLSGSTGLVLPVFSEWAAGCPLGHHDLLGETARGMGFDTAIACVGETRLARIPLGGPSRSHRPDRPQPKTAPTVSQADLF